MPSTEVAIATKRAFYKNQGDRIKGRLKESIVTDKNKKFWVC